MVTSRILQCIWWCCWCNLMW